MQVLVQAWPTWFWALVSDVAEQGWRAYAGTLGRLHPQTAGRFASYLTWWAAVSESDPSNT